MPWNRNDPDPLEARRRLLAEQERLLAEQRKRLTEQLHESIEASPVKPTEHPVWRMEDDAHQKPVADPTSTRKRHLGRQRQSDMIFFFVCIGLFLVVLVIVLIVYFHSIAPANTI